MWQASWPRDKKRKKNNMIIIYLDNQKVLAHQSKHVHKLIDLNYLIIHSTNLVQLIKKKKSHLI